MRTVAREFLALVTLVSLATGCSGQEARPPGQVAVTGTPASGPVTLAGEVTAESDAGGRPSTLLVDQLVLVFPAEMVGLVAGDRAQSDLRFLHVVVAAHLPGLRTVRTNSDGRFTVGLDPGAYVLCLGDGEGGDADPFPVTTRGCGRVNLEPGRAQEVRVSVGFGEITLSPAY